MADYHTFTSPRTTEPNIPALLAQLRGLDASAGIQHFPGDTYIIKKSTTWTGPQITAVQNIIDNAAPNTIELLAQNIIDNMPIFEKALLLTIIDQLNVIRAALPVPKPAITPADAINAVRAKAGTL